MIGDSVMTSKYIYPSCHCNGARMFATMVQSPSAEKVLKLLEPLLKHLGRGRAAMSCGKGALKVENPRGSVSFGFRFNLGHVGAPILILFSRYEYELCYFGASLSPCGSFSANLREQGDLQLLASSCHWFVGIGRRPRPQERSFFGGCCCFAKDIGHWHTVNRNFEANLEHVVYFCFWNHSLNQE